VDYLKFINSDISYLQKLLAEGPKKVLILIHRNPDGDAIGAFPGLFNLLKKLQHEVKLLVPNHYPDLSF
jgi:phosphoesterase RecJ-like protein